MHIISLSENHIKYSVGDLAVGFVAMTIPAFPIGVASFPDSYAHHIIGFLSALFIAPYKKLGRYTVR